MNKKAESGGFEQATKVVLYIPMGILITAVIFVFAIYLSSFTNKLTHVPEELQAESITVRFTNNPDCFAPA